MVILVPCVSDIRLMMWWVSFVLTLLIRLGLVSIRVPVLWENRFPVIVPLSDVWLSVI